MTLQAEHKTIKVGDSILHIPEGVNYSCSGCGRCCNGVAVPMTAEDYDRVSAIDFSKDLPQFDWSKQYRKLSARESKSTNYTHAIRPTSSGHCPFLLDKRCHIHGKYGEEVKPLICGLFPYSFNRTPSGIYLTVSFRSNAVLANFGTPLTEQLDALKEKLHVYETLYDPGVTIWDEVKLTVDKPITWEQYLNLEKRVIVVLVQEEAPLKDRLYAASDILFADLGRQAAKSADAGPPKTIDKRFIAGLFALYFHNRSILDTNENDFNGVFFASSLLFKPPSFKVLNKTYSFEQLTAVPMPLDKDVTELLTRFIYSRIFGKWYFGGGFAQISVIAGFHHLVLLLALVRLHSAGLALNRGASEISMLDIMETVRQLEEKISVAVLDGYSAALWELMLFSRQRIRRVLDACLARQVGATVVPSLKC
jgi:Fe-S-cluster containining protein